ncbi:MAG: c-type cytochrome domain-containing protein, partial [Opitutales bacterium]
MTRDLVSLLLMALLPVATHADANLAGKARAILAENCIDCHGPDKEQRKAKLRLDLLEGATRDLGGYQAVLPGKPEESELIARLVTDDEDDLMPPKKTGKSLTKEEIETLRQWIKEGASYPVHWAYRTIQPPAPPKLKNETRINNPIDRYVLSKLDQ